MEHYTTELVSTKFPNMYKQCLEARTRHKMKTKLTTKKGIEYDTNSVKTLTYYEIDNFIDFQIKNPNVILECFNCLLEFLQIRENEITGKENIKYDIHPMNKFENILKSTNFTDYLILIDKWQLFIKSQTPFHYFW